MRSSRPLLLPLFLTFIVLFVPTCRNPFALADDNKDQSKEQPKKQPTKAEKEAIERKEREARSYGTLLKRAHRKIDDYAEDIEPIRLCSVSVLYGHDSGKGNRDVRAFAQFSDGSFGLYYANMEPDDDAWIIFDKDSLRDLKDIIERQIDRTR